MSRAPEPETPSILGALSEAQHECRADNASRLAVLIERSEERLERFFRMGALHELVRYGASGISGVRAKMCTLVGIAVSLEREPALRGRGMLGVDVATGHGDSWQGGIDR